MTELVRSVYYYYASAAHPEGELDLVKERLWQFCLTALCGILPDGLVMLGDPVSGERFLRVEEIPHVVQDQVFELAAHERDVDLADARQRSRLPVSVSVRKYCRRSGRGRAESTPRKCPWPGS